MPNHVRFLYAMWAFDRGGYLQDLLHRLKYDYLRTTGTELGRLIARNLPNSVLNPIEESGRTVYLLPVPLHPSKQRKRGYNQAGAIAEGIAEITGWELTPSELAVRLRHTKTQTGLNRAGRQKNVSGAFSIVRADDLRDAVVVIVDDVFTTGATVFELADTLDHQIGEARDGFTGVITVAGA
ncbi:MAG: ComF family protein [Balneolaceae bacterium]